MITINRRAMYFGTVGIVIALSSALWATTGSGVLLNSVLNRATAAPVHEFAHSGRWNALLVTTDPTDFIIQTVQIAPGGYTGWHSHLGPVVLTVKRGTATMYRAEHGRCLRFVYPAGSAFVEPVGPHALQNESSTEVLETFNAHIIPAGAVQRVDEPDPGVCPGVL